MWRIGVEYVQSFIAVKCPITTNRGGGALGPPKWGTYPHATLA